MAADIEAPDLKKYDETFLDCRDLRHAWRLLGFYRAGGGQIGRRLACTRCNTVRHDTWTAAGAREGSNYSYPDGYSFAGSGGIDYSEVRKEQIRRASVGRSEDELIEAVYTGNGKIRRSA